MRIQIQEKEQTPIGNFIIQLSFDEKATFEVEVTHPHTPKTDEDLEWYFEDYIAEPYTAESKIKRIRNVIKDYGIKLFEQIFQNKAALGIYRERLKKDTNYEDIKIEIIGNKESFLFQSLLWESMRDPKFPKKPLVARGVQFFRKSEIETLLPARIKEQTEINLLIVTARPSEDQDVNSRTIQRPLVEVIIDTNVKVNPFILRPGTHKALIEHLQEKGSGYYHIIHFDMHGAIMSYEDLTEARKNGNLHFSYNSSFGKPTFQQRFGLEDIEPFDGKQAFLFFESDKKGVAIPVSAAEIGEEISDKRIPVCILNACQSAKQEGESEETSLAKYLQEQGVNLVLAMRYSVSVSAAKEFMEKFYTKLFKNQTIEKAIWFGKKHLHDKKERKATLNYTIYMEDWLLPVVYQRKEIDFKIRALGVKEKAAAFKIKGKSKQLYQGKYGFLGRDLDILKIEKMLIQEDVNHLLLRGMIGVGKSTLLKYLEVWWTTTKFRNVHNVFYFDWADKERTHAALIDEIAKEIFPRDYYKELKQEAIDFRVEEVVTKLNQSPYALILDNIFKFSDASIIDFLSRLTGHSFVVLGSVNPEETLAEKTFQDQVYQLDGLDKEAAYQLAGRIIKSKTKKEVEALMENNKFDFEHLLRLLAGFPNAMELVLPFLKDMSVEEVLEGFREGTLDIKFV